MPESLKTFLLSHPHKRVDSLRHICTTINQSCKGTAETLRNRIHEYVGESTERESQVKDIATKFKNTRGKVQPSPTQPRASHPCSPIVHILQGSTPTVQRKSKAREAQTLQHPESPMLSQDLFHTQNEDNEKSILE